MNTKKSFTISIVAAIVVGIPIALIFAPPQPPTAVIQKSNGPYYIDKLIEFSGIDSVDTNGKINTYSWKFGDGTDENGTEVSHSYQDNGIFTVSLTVTDNHDLQHTTTIEIEVGPNEKIPSTLQAKIDGSSSVFINEENEWFGKPETNISTWEWEIDGKFVSDKPTLTYAFTENGTRHIYLRIQDLNNNTSSVAFPVKVTNKPLFETHTISVFRPDSESCHIYQRDCYVPAVITITKGDKVIWKILHERPHTITSGNADSGPDGIFDSGLLFNAEFEFVFEKAGTYKYYSIIHPWAEGIVHVAEE